MKGRNEEKNMKGLTTQTMKEDYVYTIISKTTPINSILISNM